MEYSGYLEQEHHGEIYQKNRTSYVYNILERLLEVVSGNPDFKSLVDSSYIKIHQSAAGAKGGNQCIGLSKGGSTQRYTWLWMRMVCRSELLLQKVPHLIIHKLNH